MTARDSGLVMSVGAPTLLDVKTPAAAATAATRHAAAASRQCTANPAQAKFMTASQLPAVLEPAEIAAKLGVTLFTAQRMCRDGRFPHAFRLGRTGSRWRVPVEDLAALMRIEATKVKL